MTDSSEDHPEITVEIGGPTPLRPGDTIHTPEDTNLRAGDLVWFRREGREAGAVYLTPVRTGAPPGQRVYRVERGSEPGSIRFVAVEDTVPRQRLTSDVAFLLEALDFAILKHRGQARKNASRSPYVHHPLSVARVLAEVGGVTDTATLVAAILHDMVEDTDTTFEEVEARFGSDVRALVAEVTDDKSLDKGLRKQLQIEHAPAASHRAKEIKLADKICNVVDVMNDPPADWSLNRRREYLEWSAAVVAGCRGVNERLERRFDEVLQGARTALNAIGS